MPFLAKMSAPFRGRSYSAKEPQSKSIYTHGNDYYPSKANNYRVYNNVKDKIVDYEDDYRNDDDNNVDATCPRKRQPTATNNGHSRKCSNKEENNGRDHRKSSEKFVSRDIRDYEKERDSASSRNEARGGNKSTSNDERRSGSSRESSEDAEVAEIFVNGDSSSSATSPTARIKRNGPTTRDEMQQRSSSVTRRTNTDSPDRRENGKSHRGGRRSQEPWSEEEEDSVSSPSKFEMPAKKGSAAGNRDQLLREIENFGSLKKKNEKNAGLNLGFKAIVEKFRTRSEEKKELQKSRKQAYVDDNWRYDNGCRNGKSHRIKDHDRENSRVRRSPENEDEDCELRSKSKHRESDRSKRRSYAFEATPEEFDVSIRKYERVKREDSDLNRRNSLNDRGSKGSDDRYSPESRNGTKVARKSGTRERDREPPTKRNEVAKSKPARPKVSERHSRALTPPGLPGLGRSTTQPTTSQANDNGSAKEASAKKNFFMKEWYESNRQFAAKYLREHSKIKELSTSDVSARDEFIFGSPKDSNSLFLLESHDCSETRCRRVREEDQHTSQRLAHRDYAESASRANESSSTKRMKDVPGSSDNGLDEDSTRRNGRRVEENGGGRQRRESVEEEVEEAVSRRSESYGRSFVMPARKVWNYRDGV